MTRSPLAPASFPILAPIAGLSLAVAGTGIKYKDRDDLLLMAFDEGTNLAGVFTKSATASAPVLASRDVAKGGVVRAILVNAGNANAFTGALGTQTVNACTSALGHVLGIAPSQIATASTGVIGEPLDPASITSFFEELKSNAGTATWQEAANAIRTTDTFAKGASQTVIISDTSYHISGIAKGSGMIAPDMATMLGFIATDAGIEKNALAEMLSRLTQDSFNAITVDSDTSTSDSVYLAATGKAGTISTRSELDQFEAALRLVMVDLATQIVRDGEGATKFITIDVTPLVKTAIAGEDANWGRIVMAVGKAGEPADRDKLAITIGGVAITHDGQRRDDYDEAPVAAYMKGDEIHISVDVGIAKGRARIWTCDLTHGYITINADYRS